MKKSLIAALASAALATPAFADNQESVFECLTGTLDDEIETLGTTINKKLREDFSTIINPSDTISLEVTYSDVQKEQFISDCEARTGETATNVSRGLSAYSNGKGVTITFEPKIPSR